MSEGASSTRIAQTLSAEWGVTERQIYEYMKKARQALVKIYHQNRDEFVAAELAKLDHITDKAIQTGQLSAAVGASSLKMRAVGVDTAKN